MNSDKIKIKNIFAAVFNKSVLDPLLSMINPKSIKFCGTEGTVKYLKSKGFWAESVVSSFDFDGRVKSLDRANFVRILADRSKERHLEELKKIQSNTPRVGSDSPGVRNFEPFDLVIVDLYAPDPNNFPESMDIGGQALIRAAVKNYQNVAVAFNQKSIKNLAPEIQKNHGSTTLTFRQLQAARALKFVVKRAKLEASLFKNTVQRW